jgi:hypothetical protein
MSKDTITLSDSDDDKDRDVHIDSDDDCGSEYDTDADMDSDEHTNGDDSDNDDDVKEKPPKKPKIDERDDEEGEFSSSVMRVFSRDVIDINGSVVTAFENKEELLKRIINHYQTLSNINKYI